MKIEEYIKNYLTSKNEIAHATNIKEISLKIYYALREIFPTNQMLIFNNFHKLISYSALLHDIGNILSTPLSKAHNKVGAKLILENKIDDLSETETKIVALCVRYHRGPKPKEKHKKYASMNQKDKDTIKTISSILRLADSLDANHVQNVQNILLAYDFNQCVLTLNPRVNIMLNRGIKRVFDKKKALFEEVFKLKVCLKND